MAWEALLLLNRIWVCKLWELLHRIPTKWPLRWPRLLDLHLEAIHLAVMEHLPPRHRVCRNPTRLTLEPSQRSNILSKLIHMELHPPPMITMLRLLDLKLPAK
jgi:hypothetical protein